MPKQIITSATAPTTGFTNAATPSPLAQGIRFGNMLFVSGQGPLDPVSKEVVSTDIAAQTRQTLTNLQGVLSAAGADFRNVVNMRVCLRNTEDFPAFMVNRILPPMINEAIYTLYEGVGSVEAIDTAMRLGANHPMGPLQLADFIGLDTCLSIMQVLHDGLADSKYRPCPLLVKYVEAGWLGRKTQRGFYDYRGETPVPTR